MFTRSSANAACGGLKPPPDRRLRRAKPSSPTEHRFLKVLPTYIQTPIPRSWRTSGGPCTTTMRCSPHRSFQGADTHQRDSARPRTARRIPSWTCRPHPRWSSRPSQTFSAADDPWLKCPIHIGATEKERRPDDRPRTPGDAAAGACAHSRRDRRNSVAARASRRRPRRVRADRPRGVRAARAVDAGRLRPVPLLRVNALYGYTFGCARPLMPRMPPVLRRRTMGRWLLLAGVPSTRPPKSQSIQTCA